jgi:hypothetical protein
MRVDRGANRGITGGSIPAKESVVQKKGEKVNLTAGSGDRIRISQNQNKLSIHINEGKPVSLSPEQSRNLEITGHLENVSVDPEVSLPIRGLTASTPEDISPKKEGTAPIARKEESSFKAQVTMNFLASELKNSQSEKPSARQGSEPPGANTSLNPNLEARPAGSEFRLPTEARHPIVDKTTKKAGKEEFSVDQKGLSGIENTSESSLATATEKEISTPTGERQPVASGLKEETSLTASIKMRSLSTELEGTHPAVGDRKAEGSHAAKEDHKADALNTFAKQEIPSSLPETPVGMSELPQIKTGESRIPEGSLLMAKKQLHLLSESPEKLQSMKPEVKANLLQNLSNEKNLSVFEQHGIQTILASAENVEDFRSILPNETGLKLGQNLKHPELKMNWDRLASAYGRENLLLNPEEAPKTSGLLLENPQTLERLHIGCKPESPMQIPGSMNLKQQMHLLDRPAFTSLVLENRIREVEGRPLLDAGELRMNLFEILRNPETSKADKLTNVESLRIDSGLGEFQMREIAANPLANLFDTALGGILTERKTIFESFENNLKDTIASFGPESVAVEIVKSEHQELLEKIEPQISRFEELKSLANEIFSGPADPLIRMDRVFDKILDTFSPLTQQLLPEINRMIPGLSVFETGRFPAILEKVAHLDIPEMKTFAQPAFPFVSAITNGAYPALLNQIIPHLDPVRDKDQALLFHNGANFLSHLADGTFTNQLQAFASVVQDAVIPPQVAVSLTAMTEWKHEAGNAPPPERREPLLESGKELVMESLNVIQQSLPEMKKGISELVQDRRFANTMEAVKTGSELMVAFRNGNFVQILSALNDRMAGSVAINQIIQQGLHLTNSGVSFFRGFLNRDWERPLSTALRKSPGNKELQEVAGVFTDALNLFLPLTSVENASPFLQYQKHLGYMKDEELMNELIHQYRSSL